MLVYAVASTVELPMRSTMPMTAVLAGILLSGCFGQRVSTAPLASLAGTPERVAIGSGNVLYVLDGKVLAHTAQDSAAMPVELQSLDADDIASIEVLKGEKAKLRYGTAGENGVVLITTRHRD